MKNGVDKRRGTFTPWFWSYRWAARIEAAIVVCVFAGVIAIMLLLFNMPGPLVVHVQDDRGSGQIVILGGGSSDSQCLIARREDGAGGRSVGQCSGGRRSDDRDDCIQLMDADGNPIK